MLKMPILLNPRTGVVRYGKATMRLPTKKADVLAALAKRDGEPVQWGRLAVECWPDRATHVTRDDVRMAVFQIRSRAAKAAIPIEIVCRWGSGAYACVGVTIESSVAVHLDARQLDELRLALETCPDPKLLDRVWGYLDA